MTGTVNSKVKQDLIELKKEIIEGYKIIKDESETDLEIDEFSIDSEVIRIPKLHSKYNNKFTDETLRLKDLYTFKEKIKLERWKYYSGKQTDKYIAENGILHEKILKGDIDKYMAADEKMTLVNDVVTAQKAIVDHLERTLKEIQSRNFHLKVVVDWRKFVSGG